MKNLIFALFISSIIICSEKSFGGDVEKGVNAYIDQNYVVAHAKFSELAQQGDPNAQYWLGFMHENGNGVPQNYSEAKKWYERSAGQGKASAQVQLADMYYYGRGVAKDYVQSYAYYDLAAAQGVAYAEFNRDKVAHGMTDAEIAEAQGKATNLSGRSGDQDADDAYARAKEKLSKRNRFWSNLKFPWED